MATTRKPPERDEAPTFTASGPSKLPLGEDERFPLTLKFGRDVLVRHASVSLSLDADRNLPPPGAVRIGLSDGYPATFTVSDGVKHKSGAELRLEARLEDATEALEGFLRVTVITADERLTTSLPVRIGGK